MTVKYDKHSRKAIHYLGTIGTYQLEGNLDNVLADFQHVIANYKRMMTEPTNIRENYADGNHTKQVQFTRIYIDYSYYHDNEERSFVVKGERDLLPEEKVILEKKWHLEDEANKAARRQEYERMKKEYGE